MKLILPQPGDIWINNNSISSFTKYFLDKIIYFNSKNGWIIETENYNVPGHLRNFYWLVLNKQTKFAGKY